MRARERRVERLRSIEETRALVKERATTEARQALETRIEAVQRAHEALETSCQPTPEITSVEELELASLHRLTLRKRLVHAKAAEDAARNELHARERALVEARMAERRMEILLEGFERAGQQRERKEERRATDEHASRKTGST